jgi:hypothetical protein
MTYFKTHLKMTNKTFNQLTSEDAICIKIETKWPIVNQYQKTAIKKYFQEVVCENKVQIVDIAYETISFQIDHANHSEFFEKQNIYICFDKWINRKSDSISDVSFSYMMSEMSECFAYGGIIQCDSFLLHVDTTIDTSDWQITYFDCISSTSELL